MDASLANQKAWIMAQVSRMYYKDGCTQDVIARKFNISRSTVSRLLKEAEHEGIVKIEIHFPWQQDSKLETALKKKYNLLDVMVLDSSTRSHKEMLEGIGFLASRYLKNILQPRMTLAMATGTTIYEVVHAFEPAPHLNLGVVQMMGVVGIGNPSIDGMELAQMFAERVGGSYLYIHSPLVVANQSTRESLLRNAAIAEVLRMARSADVALVGVGTLDLAFSSLGRAGFLKPDDLENLTKAGAIGETCARPFNIKGQPVYTELSDRIMAVELPNLREIPKIIGVAGGAVKVESIHGALKGRFVNILVTDSVAANGLLAYPN